MGSTMMKFLALFLSFVPLILAAKFPGIIGATEADLPWPVVPATFNGTILGVDYQLNGTIQAVYAQFEALNPGILAKHIAEQADTINTRDNFANVEKRAKQQPPLCGGITGQHWGVCQSSAIVDGIHYLQRIGGTLNGWPRSCSRISCSYDSAIIFCNDNDYLITPNTDYLASYAQDLLNFCSLWIDSTQEWWVGGQEFDTDNYNIIVTPTNPEC